jgi:hypothetical protein
MLQLLRGNYSSQLCVHVVGLFIAMGNADRADVEMTLQSM